MGGRYLQSLCAAVLAALLLAGCGKTAPAAPSPTPTETPAPTAIPEVDDGAMHYTWSEFSLVSELFEEYTAGEYAEIDPTLSELRGKNEELGRLWTDIVSCWDRVNFDMDVPASLPDDLPGDDSLCIVVLGYALRSDGSMDDELIARCETALTAVAQYPNARILVTGGPTSFGSEVTEAGSMAAYLTEHGVESARILVEDCAQTSAENASLGAALLAERAPGVKTLAIVSSDYHVPLGVLLFYAQAQKTAYLEGEPPYEVAGCCGCAVPEKAGTQDIPVQAAFLWQLMRPSA